jgi:hypothetical protein
MNSGIAIKVNYWAAQSGPASITELDGIEEFRSSLAEEYVTVVKARPAGLGGLYQLSVEMISTFALTHLMRLVLDGAVYDFVKEGTKSFILRPFLEAYRKLRERNGKRHDADIDELRLVFQESVITIDSVGTDSIVTNLEKIIQTLAENYKSLVLPSGETPFDIHVPVFEDTAPDRPSRFRVLLNVDETIKVETADYFRLWGLWYDFSNAQRIYDVSRRLLLDQGFMDRKEYWRVMEQRWKADRERRARTT